MISLRLVNYVLAVIVVIVTSIGVLTYPATEIGILALAGVVAVVVAGWMYARLDQRRETTERAVRADYESAISARAEALQRERLARSDAEVASRMRDEFLATASHELRTPLNAIIGWTHVLKRGLLNATERQRAIDAIDRNASAQALLVDDLLDVSQLIQGQFHLEMTPLDLRVVAQAALDTLKPAAGAKDLHLASRFEHDEVPVSGDRVRLQQAVWHLVSNAVKYTPRGGRVQIDVMRRGSRALLQVADSGEGIDPSFLPHVFDPFRRASHKQRSGLGLGLALVRQLVELHGGTVTADSPGRSRGSVFTLTLPLGMHRTSVKAAS